MNKWENYQFGYPGNAYFIFYLGPFIGLIGLKLFEIVLTGDAPLWYNLMVIGAGLVPIFFSVVWIQILVIGHATVKFIEYNNGVFSGSTLSGKSFEFEQSNASVESRRFPRKRFLTFLFDLGGEHSVVTCSAGKFYLAGKMEGIDELTRLIEGAIE